MIKEAIEKIEKLSANIGIYDEEGRRYSTKPLYPVKEAEIEPLKVNNLQSLIDYLNNDPDKKIANHKHLIVQVISPSQVKLLSPVFGTFQQRETILEVVPNLPNIKFRDSLDQEEFMIMLQSCFVKTEALENLKKFAGSINDTKEIKQADDGVSQVVTVKSGVTSRLDNVIAPPNVELAPYRTFHEVEQPESKFLFRVSRNGLSLHNADGGAWQNMAIERIKEWIKTKLQQDSSADSLQVVII